MKQIANNYTFDASDKKVTLTGILVPLQRVLLIVNATRNQVIFNFAEAGRGAMNVESVSGNTVITLQYDTTTFADTDSLTIYYDDGLSREESLTLTDLDKIAGANPAEWLKAPGQGQTAARVPVDLGSTSISFSGSNITVSNEVEVKNSDGNPIPVNGVRTLAFAEIPGTAPENPTDILPANAGRSYLLFQNLSEQPIHLSFSGPATTSSLRVDGGGGLVFESGIVPSNAVSILRTAANQKYYLAHA
jgi:hypothetical protein